MRALEQARVKYRERSVRWGFYWALCCAVTWGAWYIPGTAVWYEEPFVTMVSKGQLEFLLAAAIITAFSGLAALLFLFLWVTVLGKWGEYVRTFRQPRILRWYCLGALFAGPFALFGSYLAIGYVGPIFAAISALMYPVVGATLARVWYQERISLRATIGISIILIGGISIYLPGFFGEFSSQQEFVWIGYLGGLMAAFGWGVEGAIAGHVLDVSDPDVGITIKFTAEVVYLFLLILPGVALFVDTESGLIETVYSAFNFWSVVWMILAGASFGCSYVSWYKSFPLIGVGRGQAIGALYGVFAVIFLAIFTFELPHWHFLIGLTLTIVGGFIMFTERSEMLEVIRSTT